MKVVLAATVTTAASWSSNPTSLPAIAVIALIWLVRRSMRRIEDALQSLGERMVADHARFEEQLDTRLKTLGEADGRPTDVVRRPARHRGEDAPGRGVLPARREPGA